MLDEELQNIADMYGLYTLYDVKIYHNRINELEKENNELHQKLNGITGGEIAWQGDMDRTIEQNLALKKENKLLREKLNSIRAKLRYLIGD